MRNYHSLSVTASNHELLKDDQLPAECSSAALLTRTSTRSMTSGVLRCKSRVMPSVRIQYNVSSWSGTSATRRSKPLTSNIHTMTHSKQYASVFMLQHAYGAKTLPDISPTLTALFTMLLIPCHAH